MKRFAVFVYGVASTGYSLSPCYMTLDSWETAGIRSARLLHSSASLLFRRRMKMQAELATKRV